jgi:hypothetical protein
MLNGSKLIEKWDQRREAEPEWAPEIKRCFFAVADHKEKEEKRKEIQSPTQTKRRIH